MAFDKRKRRQRIRYRIRKKIAGTAQRPRLSVFRSNRDIYVQLVDDVQGVTMASASSREDGITKEGTKSDIAKAVGKLMGERVKAAGIESVIFDRAGYLYHGRVKALAEGVREAGIQL